MSNRDDFIGRSFPKSLPYVDPGVAASVAHSMEGIDEEDYIRDRLEFLDMSNPTVAQSVRRYVEGCKPKVRNNVAMAALITYQLLESQVEANQLNDD